VANLFETIPSEFRKEIQDLESQEFGDKPYFSNSEVGNQEYKWIPNLGKFLK